MSILVEVVMAVGLMWGGFEEHLLVSSCSKLMIQASGGVNPKLARAQQTSVNAYQRDI